MLLEGLGHHLADHQLGNEAQEKALYHVSRVDLAEDLVAIGLQLRVVGRLVLAAVDRGSEIVWLGVVRVGVDGFEVGDGHHTHHLVVGVGGGLIEQHGEQQVKVVLKETAEEECVGMLGLGE